MTDFQWDQLIRRLIIKVNDAASLRRRAEAEYIRRFGHHPSDIDDDNWIDAMETGSYPGIEQVIAIAQQAVCLYEAAGKIKEVNRD